MVKKQAASLVTLQRPNCEIYLMVEMVLMFHVKHLGLDGMGITGLEGTPPLRGVPYPTFYCGQYVKVKINPLWLTGKILFLKKLTFVKIYIIFKIYSICFVALQGIKVILSAIGIYCKLGM